MTNNIHEEIVLNIYQLKENRFYFTLEENDSEVKRRIKPWAFYSDSVLLTIKIIR